MTDRLFTVRSLSTATACTPPAARMNEKERTAALTFHTETGDYFLFLSTLLSFVEETLASREYPQECEHIQLEAIRAARKDLQFIHDNYCLRPRS